MINESLAVSSVSLFSETDASHREARHDQAFWGCELYDVSEFMQAKDLMLSIDNRAALSRYTSPDSE